MIGQHLYGPGRVDGQSPFLISVTIKLSLASNLSPLGVPWVSAKLKLEEEARYQNVNLIYTHAEEKNHHVIKLNKEIGYEEV